MSSDFIRFFSDCDRWMRKPVIFTSNGEGRRGVLERLVVKSALWTGATPVPAKLAVLDIRVPGQEYKAWEVDRSLWQLQCDFSRPLSRLEKTPLGNVLFKSGTITGLIILNGQEETPPEDAI